MRHPHELSSDSRRADCRRMCSEPARVCSSIGRVLLCSPIRAPLGRREQEGREAEKARAARDAQDDTEAPDEFLDPLLNTIMQARCGPCSASPLAA